MGGTIPLWRRAFRTLGHGRRKRCRVRCRGRRVCSASMAGPPMRLTRPSSTRTATTYCIRVIGGTSPYAGHRRRPTSSGAWLVEPDLDPPSRVVPPLRVATSRTVLFGRCAVIRLATGPSAPWLTSPPAWLRTAGTSETHALVIGFADQARSFAWNQSVGLPPLTAEYATIPAGITLIALVTLVRRCWREGCGSRRASAHATTFVALVASPARSGRSGIPHDVRPASPGGTSNELREGRRSC